MYPLKKLSAVTYPPSAGGRQPQGGKQKWQAGLNSRREREITLCPRGLDNHGIRPVLQPKLANNFGFWRLM
jgi:hypothetical protein